MTALNLIRLLNLCWKKHRRFAKFLVLAWPLLPAAAWANSADVLVDMTVLPNPVISGANVTYHITVSNNGPDGATNVSLTDTLPAGLTFVSSTPSQGTCSGTTTVTCALGSLAASGQTTVDLIAQTTQAGTISNTASVSATETDPDSTNNSVTKAVTANVGADMSVTITGAPNPVIAGGNLTYTIASANGGPSPATGVTVTDTIPSGTSYVSASGTGWTCANSSGTVTCTQSGSVAVGTLASISLVVRPTNGLGGSVTDTVSIASSLQDANSANNSASVTTTVQPGADLQFASQTALPNPVAVGATITYAITGKNGGPGSASNITVTDTLPSNVTYLSATGTGWSCSNAGQTVTCTLPGPISSGSNMAVINLSATAVTAGPASNSATISFSGNDPVSGNNVSTASTTIAASGADMSITKTGTPNPVANGANITYTLAPKNNGPNATAGTITVTDTLPGTLTYVSATGSGWSCSVSGQTITCTIANTYASGVSLPNITVVATATGSGSIVNTACIAVASPTDPNSGNNCSSATTTSTTNEADLAVSQSASPDPVLGGGTLTYSINVVNNGPNDATSVSLSDTFSNATFISATSTQGTCTQSTSMTCSLGTVTNGSTATITAQIKPTATGTRSNTASASSSGVGDPVLTNNTSTITSTVSPAADLSLTHTANPNPVTAATSLTYVLTARNNGPSSGTNVTVVETLPANATYVSATPSSGSCSYAGSVITCNLGTLASGTQQTVTILVTPVPQGTSSYTMTASGTVSADQADPNSANNAASYTSTVNPAQVDVQVTKYGNPNPVAFGSNVTYAITVHNSGPSTATGVVATDTPMSQFTYVSATPSQGSCTGTSPVVCSLGTILNGANATISMVMTASTMGTYTNSVSVASNESDSNSANNTANESSTSQQGADLSITKTGSPNPVQKDAPLTYTMTVGNTGPATSTTTTVTDVLPTGTTFVSATATQGTCSNSSGTVTCALGSLAAAANATVTLAVTPTVAGALSNTASVTGSAPDPNSANNTATAAVSVNPVADLTITKTHSGNFSAGQTGATYTITATNSGGAATTAPVTVVDSVPSGLTPTAATGTGWSCSIAGQVVTCTRSDTLAASTAYPAITLTANVGSNAPSSVTNTVTVSGGGEVRTSNDTASNATTIVATPDLSITKSHTGNFTQGQTGATFAIGVTNAGNAATASVVTVSDTLPADLTPVSGSGTGWACSVSAQVVTCTRSDALAAAANYPNISVAVNVSPSAAPSVVNTATVAVSGDVNTANNSASDTVTITGAPDLSITKTHTGNFTQGQTGAAYTISVSNVGGAATSGQVTVTDTMPTGLTPSAGSGAGWSCTLSAPVVTCTRVMS